MFLKKTIERNRKLIDSVIELHKSGRILPDSFVLDLDTFEENARNMLKKANKFNIKMYFMLKQLGHNPFLARLLTDLGYDGAVSVDFREAMILMDNNIPISNVGHLVQVPKALIGKFIDYGVKNITVYSLEKIRDINEEAKKLGIRQNILLRITSDNDFIYPGQTAGFNLDDLEYVYKYIDSNFKYVNINGLTSFPCYLYDKSLKDIKSTENLNTLKKAKNILDSLGKDIEIMNLPSATCCRTLDLIKEDGGNVGEPGHGLTGTTPMHADVNLEELPALIYLSEISHNFNGNAYCYGGGHYRRSRLKKALIVDSNYREKVLDVYSPEATNIDYHFSFNEECEINSSVLMAFRYQIFVSRSDLILLKGVKSMNPKIVGVFDSLGRRRDYE